MSTRAVDEGEGHECRRDTWVWVRGQECDVRSRLGCVVLWWLILVLSLLADAI